MLKLKPTVETKGRLGLSFNFLLTSRTCLIFILVRHQKANGGPVRPHSHWIVRTGNYDGWRLVKIKALDLLHNLLLSPTSFSLQSIWSSTATPIGCMSLGPPIASHRPALVARLLSPMLVLSAALFAVCLASASDALTSYRSRDGGPLALAKIYYKYGVPLPDDLAAAVSRLQHTKRATGSTLATPEGQDLLYLVSVDIGTPPQRLNVDIDTGSGDFWVFSSLMLKNQVGGQAVYNPSNSTTASKLGDSTWEITYGDGSTSGGVVYLDQVTIGGLGVLSQAVEVATHVSEGFTGDSNNDGILGLALANNHVRPTKQKTFFGNLQPILDQPLFTVDLKKDAGKFARFASVTPPKTQLNPYSWPL